MKTKSNIDVYRAKVIKKNKQRETIGKWSVVVIEMMMMIIEKAGGMRE